jgi:hypothetical protein
LSPATVKVQVERLVFFSGCPDALLVGDCVCGSEHQKGAYEQKNHVS